MAVLGFPGLAEAGELIAKEKAPKLMVWEMETGH